jgi:hypothetical protein
MALPGGSRYKAFIQMCIYKIFWLKTNNAVFLFVSDVMVGSFHSFWEFLCSKSLLLLWLLYWLGAQVASFS